MSSIVESLNRIKATADKFESYLKWHPKPVEPPRCPQCERQYGPAIHVVKDYGHEGAFREVYMSAEVKLAIHRLCRAGDRLHG